MGVTIRSAMAAAVVLFGAMALAVIRLYRGTGDSSKGWLVLGGVTLSVLLSYFGQRQAPPDSRAVKGESVILLAVAVIVCVAIYSALH